VVSCSHGYQGERNYNVNQGDFVVVTESKTYFEQVKPLYETWNAKELM